MAAIVSPAQARRMLGGLPGWSLAPRGRAIRRQLKLQDFVSAVKFIQRLTPLAERAVHHPDLVLKNYNEVTITLTTHDAGGLTRRDFALARKINRLVSRLPK